MQELLKYGLLALAIGLIEIFIYSHIYGSYNPVIIIGCLLVGCAFAYVAKQYYDNKNDTTNSEDDEDSDTWITIQTIMNTDFPTEEYYGRRFNLKTKEILTKGHPKSKWVTATHLKDEELDELLELVDKIKPYALTDDNIVKTHCVECSSDKYSLMITLQKNNKMSVLKTIMNKTIISTDDDICNELVHLVEKIDHWMPYWNTQYVWI